MPIKVKNNTAALKKTLDALSKHKVEIGIYDDEENLKKAIIHEMGSSTVPSRPFLSRTLNENEAKYRSLLTSLAQDALNNGTDPIKALEEIGDITVADVHALLDSGTITPPLAQSTIDRKGHNKPLLDTESMRNSVQSRVVLQDKKEDK